MNKRTLSICGAAMFLSMLVSSAFGYEKEIEELSAKMATKIADKGKKTVAVVDFTDLEGNVTQLDRMVAEEFSVALAGAGKGFKVIERNQINRIIKENKLSETGLIDADTVKKLGKFIAVDAIVTGTVTPFGDNMRVTVKILDTVTAELIDGLTENLAKTKAVDDLLGKEIAPAASAEPGGAKKIEAKSAQKTGKANSGAFSDDFNAGPKPDWKPINGNWTMSNGQYTVTDIKQGEWYYTFIEGKNWRNLSLDIDVTPGYNSSNFHRLNICPRMISQQEKVCFGMTSKYNKFNGAYWFIIKEGAEGEPVSWVDMETAEGQSIHVKIEVKNGVFTAYANGGEINQVYDATYPSGSVSLAQWYEWWGDHKIRMGFDNLEIKPLAD